MHIFRAARIHTLAPDGAVVREVGVDDGRIVAVGDDLSDRYPDADVTDYGSAVLTPGLRDGHTHPTLGLGLTQGIELTDLLLSEVRVRLHAAASTSSPGQWVSGWGLDPNIFTGIGFDGTVFDDVTGDVPIFLRMRDAHSAIINSAAIAAAGVTGRETFDDEARVDVDADGVPTGYLVELSALDLVGESVPTEPFDQRAKRLHTLLSAMAATGITATDVMDFSASSAELADAVEATSELPVRLRFSPWIQPGMSPAQLGEVADLIGTGGRRWHVGGVKFFIDGTVDNGTAWLDHADCFGQNVTSVWTDPVEYQAALRFFVEREVPTATHAIGDGGVRYALDSLAAAGVAGRTAPHRIEHIETIPDDLVARFADLGVIASMQPIHGTHHTRADLSDNWSTRLGPERAARGWRCADLLAAGVPVALGSDWPVTPFDARASMADAMLRRPVARPDLAPISPSQALTPMQALLGYTVFAAAASGTGSGRVEVGQRADFTVFGADPLDLSPAELASVPVMATVLDGRPVS